MKTVVFCSSAAFYKHVNELADALEKRGLTAVVPETAARMRESGDYDVNHANTWFANPGDYYKKAKLMHGHFDNVAAGDAILVVNDEKHGVPGYIGANVLMEMGLAFHLNKPIFVLYPAAEDSPVYEEVMGMGSVILDGDLMKLTERLQAVGVY